MHISLHILVVLKINIEKRKTRLLLDYDHGRKIKKNVGLINKKKKERKRTRNIEEIMLVAPPLRCNNDTIMNGPWHQTPSTKMILSIYWICSLLVLWASSRDDWCSFSFICNYCVLYFRRVLLQKIKKRGLCRVEKFIFWSH